VVEAGERLDVLDPGAPPDRVHREGVELLAGATAHVVPRKLDPDVAQAAARVVVVGAARVVLGDAARRALGENRAAGAVDDPVADDDDPAPVARPAVPRRAL